ncbi:MAG: hypothetical protein U9N73_03855 [Candidatus Auribacterota bacterium]|nr:hypothetical protein [Candidatus Auribacterota bacterium]
MNIEMETITKNSTLVEAIQREINICDSAVKRYEKILNKFEKKYHLTSQQFNDRFNKGTLGDDHDFFEWYAIYDYYHDWVNRRQTLREFLV